MVIQPYCQFHFSANPSLRISDVRVSLDKFLILDGYSLLEAGLRWFYCSLSLCGGGWGGGGTLGWGGSVGVFAAGLGGALWGLRGIRAEVS